MVDFEWCRKAKYNVKIELGCFLIREGTLLPAGFIEKTFDIDGVPTKFAVKKGYNILEQNSWTTSPNKPYIVTGTVGERWPIKPSNLTAYDIDPKDLSVVPQDVSTKDPSDQEFLIAVNVPKEYRAKVIPSWAFGDDGTIDETQIMLANSDSSLVPHLEGDYIVAKHIPGKPEYMALPEKERNTKEAAMLYDPRIINGSVMQNTYDHARTQEEIIAKYSSEKVNKI